MEIFTFTIQSDAIEKFTKNALRSEATTGARFGRNTHAGKRFMLDGTMLFPNESGLDYDTLVDFFDAVGGTVTPFLLKPVMVRNRFVVSEDLGVSAGGASIQFALASRFIDASSVAVSVDAAPETNFTLEGNTLAYSPSPTPYILSTGGFAAGTQVLIDYERYFAVNFDMEDLGAQISLPSRSVASEGTFRIAIAVSEPNPGISLVS